MAQTERQESTPESGSEPADTDSERPPASTGGSDDRTRRRIRTLAIFFLGIGVYAVVGAGLDQAALLLDNLTTYFVSGLVVLVVGFVLLALAR